MVVVFLLCCVEEKLKGGEAAGGDLVSAVATAERMEKTDDSQDWD